MPFMIGPSPIRRTLPYLSRCDIYFRDFVKVFSLNYTKTLEHHQGAAGFVHWHLPQIQYRNPDVQCITFKKLTPSPFIRIFLEDGKSVLIDCESRTKEQIYHHLRNFTALVKTQEELKLERLAEEKKDNPANFGHKCERQCTCEIMGQVPCPNLVPLPYYLRGPKQKNAPIRIPDYLKLAELNERKNHC